MNPKLHAEFRGDPFFAPRPIRRRHRRNKLLQIVLNRRASRPARFPAPKQSEPFAMPSKHRLRSHDKQQRAPLEEAGQCDEGDPGSTSARRGFTRRSWYIANCFRKNKFSAESWACDRIDDDSNDAKSQTTQRIVRNIFRAASIMAGRIVSDRFRS